MCGRLCLLLLISIINSRAVHIKKDKIEKQQALNLPANESRKISGNIKLNGETYQTECKCIKNPVVVSKCLPPTKLRVRQEQFNRLLGLSKESLHDVLGGPENWTSSARHIHYTSFHCVDGRETEAILGTPGGDFGEFFNALNEYEKITEQELELDEVISVLHEWLNFNNNFSLRSSPSSFSSSTPSTEESASSLSFSPSPSSSPYSRSSQSLEDGSASLLALSSTITMKISYRELGGQQSSTTTTADASSPPTYAPSNIPTDSPSASNLARNTAPAPLDTSPVIPTSATPIPSAAEANLPSSTPGEAQTTETRVESTTLNPNPGAEAPVRTGSPAEKETEGSAVQPQPFDDVPPPKLPSSTESSMVYSDSVPEKLPLSTRPSLLPHPRDLNHYGQEQDQNQNQNQDQDQSQENQRKELQGDKHKTSGNDYRKGRNGEGKNEGEEVEKEVEEGETRDKLLKMYFHTDTASIHQLELNLNVHGRRGPLVGLNLEDPPTQYQSPLLDSLIRSRFQGCDYVRALLDNPERFYVRPQLLHYFIQAFFKTLWDKTTLAGNGVTPLSSLLDFQILEGVHEEKAWINFRGNAECEHEHIAPSVHPQSPHASLFVNHPVAVQVHREKLAKFFAIHAQSAVHSPSENQLYHRFNYRGGLNMLETASLLGRDVPYYTVTVE